MELKAMIPIFTDTERCYGGRFISKELLEKACEEYNKKEFKLGQIWGRSSYFDRITLSEVSHKITELNVTDNNIEISIDTLDTPSGKKIIDMIDNTDYDMKITPVWFKNVENSNIPDITRFDVKFIKKE